MPWLLGSRTVAQASQADAYIQAMLAPTMGEAGIIDGLLAIGLSPADIARATGVSTRSVRRRSNGISIPRHPCALHTA